MRPLEMSPPRVAELSRFGSGNWTLRWEEIFDGRRLGYNINLRGRTLIEARKEVETIWPGSWEWSNERGRRAA